MTVQDIIQAHIDRRRLSQLQDNMGKGYFVSAPVPQLAFLRLCNIVHGSLARAGKVKSQTPKVDKQEKKKTPKGRAKKRILYNRR
jgi:ribosomal protein S30